MAKKKGGGSWPSWGVGWKDGPKEPGQPEGPKPKSGPVKGPSEGKVPDSYIGYHNTMEKRIHKHNTGTKDIGNR